MTMPEQTEIRHLLTHNLDDGFTKMVHRYQPGIYSGVVRLTRHHHDAQDVAQDTFVRAYTALEAYSDERIATLALRPWLWTIALNLCRNRATRTKQTSPLLSDDAIHHSDDEPLDLDAWNLRFDRLSIDQRNAVVLRHVVGLPIAEISTITSRPDGTVKTDISRGLDKLRVALTVEVQT
ncbi:MAG: sigma-70 family RNA polymerase sigma factor [Proteobacteria bacterium]|nr:sigma-70 family RNA polymerase sigma factor [Pseudomonadota bacterium]